MNLKSFSALLVLILATSTTFAANVIECTRRGDQKVIATLTRQVGDKTEFNITLDESVTTGYATIEDFYISPKKSSKANADVLDGWDGSNGVTISFAKGFLSAAPGATTKSYVKVIYNDVATDFKSTPVVCAVRN